MIKDKTILDNKNLITVLYSNIQLTLRHSYLLKDNDYNDKVTDEEHTPL